MAQKIGELTDRIKYRLPLSGRGAAGGVTKTWVDSTEVWAKVNFLLASKEEEEEAGRKTEKVMANFHVRYNSEISEGMRIQYTRTGQSQEFEIISVLPSKDRQYMTIEGVQAEPFAAYNFVDQDGNTWIDPDGNLWEWVFEGSNLPGIQFSRATFAGLNWSDKSGRSWGKVRKNAS